VVRPNIYQNEIIYQFGRLKTDIKEYSEFAAKGFPFDFHVDVYNKGSEGYGIFDFSKGSAHEFAYISEDIPNINSISEINIIAEHVVQKIVELMLLPSID